jgi:hypothetical protein
MKKYIKIATAFVIAGVFMKGLPTLAATSLGLGLADPFVVLSSTYTNTSSGTILNGDLGYTTPPALAPTVNGTTHSADSTYNQAGIDQGTALAALNSQPCTFSFAHGAIDLASDATHGAAGVYGPGVYCIAGAASIGGGGTITLNGSGTYIFRMTGALNSSANSIVALLNGASACNVWWTPGAATTLGANSTFIGTDIDASGVTIGNVVSWIGKALAFGGTISTSSDTVTTSACTVKATATATPTTTPTPAVALTTTPSATVRPVPGLPNTGLHEPEVDNTWQALIIGLLSISAIVYVVRKKIGFSKNHK